MMSAPNPIAAPPAAAPIPADRPVRPRRPRRPADTHWPRGPRWEFMPTAARPAWLAAEALVKALPAADRDELAGLIHRPAGGGKAPASHPEAWLIAPARIDALLAGRNRLRAAFVAWLAAIGVPAAWRRWRSTWRRSWRRPGTSPGKGWWRRGPPSTCPGRR